VPELQALIDGVTEGAIIALAAMAVTLVFRISHFANVAFGDFMTVGAFAAYGVVSAGLSLLVGAVVGLVVTALIGVISYYLVFKPLGHRPVTMFITSIGVALVLRAIVQMIWGGDVETYSNSAISSFHFGSIVVTVSEAIVVGVCAVVATLFFVWLNKTGTGREIRAVASNETLALVKGVNVIRVTATVWAVAAALTAIAGVLLGYTTALSPEMGWNLLLPAFAAAILGGLGNTTGAVVGGLVIGMAMQFAVIWVPAGYKYGVSFAIMVIVLLFRPSGIMPRRVRV